MKKSQIKFQLKFNITYSELNAVSDKLNWQVTVTCSIITSQNVRKNTLKNTEKK